MINIHKFLLFRCIMLKRSLRYFIIRLKNKNNFVIKLIQKSRMHLDLKDEGISKDLILDGVREPESTIEIQSILNPGDSVVDLGANVGYYTLIEASLVGKK